jgi:hypothetical protein
MDVQIEPLVHKQLGKEVNRIAQEQVRDIFKNGKITKTKSEKFDFDDEDEDSFIDSDEVELSKAEMEAPTGMKEEDMDKILADIEAKESFDLFSEVGDAWLLKGQVVKYDINKNGKLLTKKEHPYSWEQLQKDFGGGSYKVMARLPANNNKYLKAQNKQLLDAPEQSPEYLIKNLMEKTKASEEKNNSNQGINMLEVLETVRKANEASLNQAAQMRRESAEMADKARQEAKEEARSTIELFEKMMERNKPVQATQPDLLTQLTPLLTAILPKLLEKKEAPPVVDNSKQTFDMMMKIQQMNIDMMKEQSETTKEMFKNMSEQIKEMAKEKNKTTTPDRDPMEFYLQLKDAEDRGFEKYQMLNELAKERAEEREEMRGEKESSGEKDSTVDTLIKGLLPVLAGKMAGGGQMQAPPQIARPSAPRPVAPPQVVSNPRRSVSPSNTNGLGNGSHQKGDSRTTIQANPSRTNEENRATSEAGLQRSQKPLAIAHEVTASSIDDFLSSGDEPLFSAAIPTHIDDTPKVEKIADEEIAVTSVVSPVLSSSKDQQNANRILEFVVPIAIDGYMSENETIETIAEKSITELETKGIDLATVKRDFDEETLLSIIGSLPDNLQQTVKDLRNVIFSKIDERIRF